MEEKDKETRGQGEVGRDSGSLEWEKVPGAPINRSCISPEEAHDTLLCARHFV
jgi:hypothetical protein